MALDVPIKKDFMRVLIFYSGDTSVDGRRYRQDPGVGEIASSGRQILGTEGQPASKKWYLGAERPEPL
jgi:hypothetical protein